MDWVIWALLLIGQNGAHTWTSRARNSKSIKQNAIASLFSNGIWIVSLAAVVGKVTDGVSLWLVAPFYIVFTMLGSVGMHFILLRRECPPSTAKSQATTFVHCERSTIHKSSFGIPLTPASSRTSTSAPTTSAKQP